MYTAKQVGKRIKRLPTFLYTYIMRIDRQESMWSRPYHDWTLGRQLELCQVNTQSALNEEDSTTP